MESKFVLGVDLDGICADFLGACAFLEEKLGHRNLWPALRSARHPEWLEEILTGYQYDRSLYSALNPIPYAASSLTRLAEPVEIVYITARPMFAKQDTLLWLERHGFPGGLVINVRGNDKVAAAKRERVDVFIEDRLMYANPLASAGIFVNLLDVYDRNLDALHGGIAVMRSWHECRAAIEEIRRYE